jgi:ABC-type Fe3+ transport system substrate-binding protein
MRRLLVAIMVVGMLAGIGLGIARAGTKEVVIVTSFPKELFETYKKAFEAKHPGIAVVVNSKPTPAGVTFLQETKARPVADIFWVSAPDAFLTLKNDGILEKYAPPKEIASKIPAKIGSFPISDPDGTFFGFAVSGYGLMWNKPYMQMHKLPDPKEWTDLANPKYHGHLVISAPSRSGTTHLTVEVILQAYGWEKGWELLLTSGGNMGSITERSFGVPEAVNSGQFGIGVVIDFFGLSAIASGFPVDFVYPSMTSVVPASVGIVKGGPNPENARAFVNFLLSEAGQTILFNKDIARLPVVPELYAKAPAGYPNPFKMKMGGVEFDNKLSSARRNVVISLYDQIISFRHAELKAAWGAIYRAEDAIAKAAGRDVAKAKALVAEARKLASGVPIDAKRAADKEINAAFRDKAKADMKSKLEAEWDTFAKANYAKAKGQAEQALAVLR